MQTHSADLTTRIAESIENNIKPAIQKDGGDITFVQFQDGIVSVRLSGACIGCPSSFFTLKMGICEMLQAQFPEIVDVIAVE